MCLLFRFQIPPRRDEFTRPSRSTTREKSRRTFSPLIFWWNLGCLGTISNTRNSKSKKKQGKKFQVPKLEKSLPWQSADLRVFALFSTLQVDCESLSRVILCLRRWLGSIKLLRRLCPYLHIAMRQILWFLCMLLLLERAVAYHHRHSSHSNNNKHHSKHHHSHHNKINRLEARNGDHTELLQRSESRSASKVSHILKYCLCVYLASRERVDYDTPGTVNNRANFVLRHCSLFTFQGAFIRRHADYYS